MKKVGSLEMLLLMRWAGGEVICRCDEKRNSRGCEECRVES
jgi:hypothetical protein